MPNREEMAAALMRDMQGLDGAQFDPEGPEFGADDPISRGGLTTLAVQMSVANAAALDVNLFDQAHNDNAALPTGLVSVNGVATIAEYKKLLRYLLTSPSQIRSILIQSSESASAAPVLASMQITPTRSNSFGLSMSNTKLLQSYQTTQDFQANRVTLPMVVTVDSFTYVRFLTGTNNSGSTVTFNLSVIFGQRAEARKQIGGARGVVIRPGGRGPAAV